MSYLQQLHGVAGRVSASDTAFNYRGNLYDFAIISQWPDPAANEKNVAWTKEFFIAMQPRVEEGVNVNNLGEEGEDRVRAAYGTNYERAVALKNKYDPTNFFHMNQNIRPTSAEVAARVA